MLSITFYVKFVDERQTELTKQIIFHLFSRLMDKYIKTMKLDIKTSEMIAIKGIQYLAGDEEQLGRFLTLTGCDPSDLRTNAESPGFLAGILEFFMGNEPTLLAFCAQYSINPEDIAIAQHVLGTNPGEGHGDFDF